jgi:hypothetical protein
MDYAIISVWLLTTLMPNVAIGWKKGGWYCKWNGRYISRECAAVIWFLWITVANCLLYPILESLLRQVYARLQGIYAIMLFIVLVACWFCAFIYRGGKNPV